MLETKYNYGFSSIIILLLVVFTALALLAYFFNPNNFESCAKLPGSIIQETYPSTCTSFWGKTFYEENDEALKKLTKKSWQTFSYKDPDFQISYPASWTYDENPFGGKYIKDGGDEGEIMQHVFGISETPPNETWLLLINVYDTNLNTLYDYPYFGSPNPTFIVNGESPLMSKKEIVFGDTKAIKVKLNTGETKYFVETTNGNNLIGFESKCFDQIGNTKSSSCQTVDKVLTTLRFTDSKAGEIDLEEIYCGDFSGIECPKNYKCKLVGNFPNAGGKCVQKSLFDKLFD